MTEYKKVDVSNILNYSENPRHDIGISEVDTLKKLIQKVGSQFMYNMAKDIYLNGLVSSNLPVLVYNSEEKKYVVYEGNRRIACLKFLKNSKILTKIDKSLKSKIDNLISKEKREISYKIFCCITDSENAYFIMERTHSGENQGRGTKAWTPKEKDVFYRRQKQKNTIALLIVDLTEKYLDFDITQKLPHSTIQRLFNNKAVKLALNIEKDTNESLTKGKIVLINYLIDRTIEESGNIGLSITRLFNKAEEIADFLLPLILEYESSIITDEPDSSSELEDKGDQVDNDEITDDQIDESNIVTDLTLEKDINLKFSFDENVIYYTYQTIELFDRVIIQNKEKFISGCLEIESGDLNVVDQIVQPNNNPGEYSITYKYYMDNMKEKIYWQDTLKIYIKLKKTSAIFDPQQTVLSKVFVDRYYEQLVFDHSDKFVSLMIFLATEHKNGKNSFFINIVSRMFLEYTFRLYASKILKLDNQTIDDRSGSLRGLIDYCCNQIEQLKPSHFVKHIRQGRKESTSKIEILQKSVHYFDVTISNEDIQVMFKNLTIYLEYVYDELLRETLHMSG